jgi:hypothetical protein
MTENAATEATPLLRDATPGSHAERHGFLAWLRSAFHVENRILLAGFVITLSFSYTQVP